MDSRGFSLSGFSTLNLVSLYLCFLPFQSLHMKLRKMIRGWGVIKQGVVAHGANFMLGKKDWPQIRPAFELSLCGNIVITICQYKYRCKKYKLAIILSFKSLLLHHIILDQHIKKNRPHNTLIDAWSHSLQK